MYIGQAKSSPPSPVKLGKIHSRKILLPLGVTTTISATPPSKSGYDYAFPHSKVDGQLQPIEFVNLDNAAPAGSINSSAAQKWPSGSRCTQPRKFPTGNERLFTEAQSREMWSAQTILPAGQAPAAAPLSTKFAGLYA